MPDEESTDGPSERPPTEVDASREQVLEAVREVRREGAKAGILHGTVDGLFVFFLVMLGLTLFGIRSIGPTFTVPTPETMVTIAADIGLILPATLVVEAPVILGAVAGLLIFSLEFVLLYRRYTIERFEQLNPPVREALRTARDSAHSGAESPVARVLYRDVIEKLTETSSREFIGVKRLTVVIVLVAILAVAVVGVSVTGIQLGPGEGWSGIAIGGGEEPVDGNGIPDPGAGVGEGTGAVLGDRAEIDRGTVEAGLRLEGDDNGEGDAPAGGAYDARGFDIDPADIQAPPAEFTDEDRIEDADVIREYNERIRAQDRD